MERRFYINYENTPFLKTSKTSAIPNRLNWRCEVLLARNQEAIRDKGILDLASHDGRFSYACLRLGAKHVTGVEGRSHLVKFASDNLMSLGYGLENFSFVEDDVFDYLPKVEPKEFDTILCFGLFYHMIRQIELLRQIKRVRPRYFILDTNVAKEESWLAKLVNVIPRIRFKHFMHLNTTLKNLGKAGGVGRLVFQYEDHVLEGATIDNIDLIALPTKSLIEVLLKSHGFTFKQLCWNKEEIKNLTGLRDYKSGGRVSYIAQLL